MADDPDISAHIESVGARAEPDTHRLITLLAGRSSDRSQPAALDWVRRWGPRRISFAPPACSCAAGRCSVCN